MKEKISNLLEKIREHKKKLCLAVGLAALIGVTAVKDNVHFGSVNIRDPQENHYSWGIGPATQVEGEGKCNIYTFGLLAFNNVKENSKIEGNQRAYGLIAGVNVVGNNSSITGEQGAYGLIGGVNVAGNNSSITGKQD